MPVKIAALSIRFLKKQIHIILMLLGIIVGVVFIKIAVENKDRELRNTILAQAQSIELALGWGAMPATIEQAEAVDELKVQDAAQRKKVLAAISLERERIAKICAVNPDCRAVYLMRQLPNKQIIFLIDSLPEKSELFIEPGTVYKDASAPLYKVFNTNSLALDGPYDDYWGRWMSAFVPHVMPDKSVVVVGVDVEAKHWNTLLINAAIIPLFATLAYLLLMTLSTMLWRAKNAQNQNLLQTQVHLLKLSHEDNLTGLANRRYFDDRLEQMIVEFQRKGLRFSIFYLDLDGFKQINDSYGHSTGDEVLKEVSRRLKNALGLDDTVARLAGDEFALLLPRVDNNEEASTLARNLIDEIVLPIQIEGISLSVTVSIGIAIFSEHFSTSYKLLKAADEALYVAKNEGKNRFYFAEDIVQL